MKRFRTTHNLKISIAPQTFAGRPTGNTLYKIGTCHGFYRSTNLSVDIIAMVNDEPGNGHFDDVLQWFTEIARLEGKLLRVVEIMNPEIATRLIQFYGFHAIDAKTVVKHDFMKRPKKR